MTDQQLQDMLATLVRSQAETDRRQRETDRQLRETDQHLRETDQHLRETDQHLRETDRQLRELGKQIGGLGEKFGGFTEGMAFPSMRKLLEEHFHARTVGLRHRARLNGETMEIDVVATAQENGGEVYLVEVKSLLRQEGIEQTLRKLQRFSEFFPEHRGKRVYGIVAAVDVPEEVRRKTLAEGLYLARIHGDLFELTVPEDFVPRAFPV